MYIYLGQKKASEYTGFKFLNNYVTEILLAANDGFVITPKVLSSVFFLIVVKIVVTALPSLIASVYPDASSPVPGTPSGPMAPLPPPPRPLYMDLPNHL